ncbi:iron uptake system component EfeO [Lampropedia hyalina DSM 16112]|jgi:iron uptake system component EfeO|uniref:Iron uptake system component EfeO n=1 Tax=Lampropedia hyalina DSM 16112 TaxID=1122156 RepID=A0A1M5EXH5_9BURK|nr:iron uptake system protein EfeO [Lampropedia hyalina]SHF83980.1 iron uptake system component EfeO [Lampropedia hyalina DSM 16112]
MTFKRLLTVAALMAGTATTALAQQAQALDLVAPIAEYKIYVSENVDQLVKDTTAFVQAVKAGEVDKAKALYAPTRVSYERVEPIAELFSDLDVSIDSRADDYEGAEKDPAFPGFHRIEYSLWVKNSADDVKPVADKLLADVKELQSRIDQLTFPPEVVVGGAAVLMEEVAATKISGEENRYSKVDLWDFKANTDGSYKIVELVRPLIAKKEATFLAEVDKNFKTVYDILKTYEAQDGKGYVSYEKLTDKDRTVMAAAINQLAEDLSTLRGKLGLD